LRIDDELMVRSCVQDEEALPSQDEVIEEPAEELPVAHTEEVSAKRQSFCEGVCS
jgi:hypothetical protein